MTGEYIKQVLQREEPGTPVAVSGWLKTARHGKTCSFLAVNDGSCLESLQVVVEEELENFEEVRLLAAGAAVSVTGTLVASLGNQQRYEVKAEEVRVEGMVDQAYPLQKKHHSFEFLRTIGHLRMRSNSLGAVMRVRNALSRVIHGFFQDKGFLHLHAPIISGSDCEGAGQMFRVSVLDPANPPRRDDGTVDFGRDFFGKETFLTVSGQLEAEIAAHAFRNVYTFGPTFRAENSNTRRHLAEFWMVEPEMAFCDLEGDVALAEEFLKALCGRIVQECADDIRFFDERVDPGLLDRLGQVVETSFARLTYTEAVEILGRSGKRFEFAPAWGMDLQSEHERYLTEEYLKKPVIVTDYPTAIKPFYMYQNDDGRTVRAMDILVPGIGEIVGGSQREHRLAVLEKRIDDARLRREDYWWYLELRKYGSVPHAGFGLGFDRAVQFLTGMVNIRDVIPFPRSPGAVEF